MDDIELYADSGVIVYVATYLICLKKCGCDEKCVWNVFI